MQTAAVAGTDGFVSSFVEIFVWLMTMPAYEALWELLCPSVNPYGWGYDFWYDGYARARVPGHRMGILSTLVVKHEQNTEVEGAGRTDNTKIDDKWRAVLAQEKHYLTHRGIDLKKYRNTLDIANTSWNGAVKAYLKMLPAEGEIPLGTDIPDTINDRDMGERGPKMGHRQHRKKRKEMLFLANTESN